ncbi:unnamed protein product [Ceratitis capitata]|uniref:RING-type E3 ubiquitin transferase n=1 Tax=Ceratitis capitata TaxID=7213 RepID=A0A811U226_CERCA|nr:unnamed protein product [Ceratitis capitata]
MAEAVVDERTPLPTRFYCHMCSMEVNIPNTDFTCPHCSGGFVESCQQLQILLVEVAVRLVSQTVAATMSSEEK